MGGRRIDGSIDTFGGGYVEMATEGYLEIPIPKTYLTMTLRRPADWSRRPL
jgi:hypothetical protein